ncbi:MAG TPA: DMT family transporter [Gaiella sp.]|jgi:drug/metabolite transporter (DMT)-like permease
METAVLALLGAVSWGTGDFFGGLASRKAHVLTVLVVSQAVGLVGVAAWAIASGDAPPGLGDVLPAVGAGAAGAVGLAALYRGMAIGAMGIVAPISAVSPVVPLGVDLVRGDAPAALQWAGIATALAGVVLLAREPGTRGGREGLAAGVSLALVAALGFGLFIVGIDAASDGGATWAVVVARASSSLVALCAVLLVSVPLRPPTGLLPAIVAVGVFDTTANVLVALATTHGSAGIVAVLSALYPLTTILLARAFLAERLDRPRRIGGVLALAGAALVAVG